VVQHGCPGKPVVQHGRQGKPHGAAWPPMETMWCGMAAQENCNAASISNQFDIIRQKSM